MDRSNSTLVQSITVVAESPFTDEAATLLEELSVTLANISGSSGKASFDLTDMLQDRALFAVARDATGLAVGCGAIRPIDKQTGEVKRMYARPGTKGVGAAILAFLESYAAEAGYQRLILETRRINQRAVAFYRSKGYSTIENYGKYVGNDLAICFEKCF